MSDTCSWSVFGCTTTGPREQIEAHEDDPKSTIRHLLLMRTHTMTAQREMQAKIQALETNLAQAKIRIETLETAAAAGRSSSSPTPPPTSSSTPAVPSTPQPATGATSTTSGIRTSNSALSMPTSTPSSSSLSSSGSITTTTPAPLIHAPSTDEIKRSAAARTGAPSTVAHLPRLIEDVAYFHGPLNVAQADALLKGKPAGTFLVRNSESDPSRCLVMVTVDPSRNITHSKVFKTGPGKYSAQEGKVFPSLEAFVTAHAVFFSNPLPVSTSSAYEADY
eukprot:TRINITY_DN4002_c0_g1_i1.p1 TRINITY_DN4002_c0_g1~~TRINITY_DN4002_c0_g1_i1.p1  ORF type:complete len:290 (-),score=69.26 TRINITY_DN4002_c0_g1_i1:25-858(-)